MLLQQEIKTVETREIALPFHCRKISYNTEYYYRVNKDESVLAITVINGHYAVLSVSKSIDAYQRGLISAATPCTASEVEEAKNKALEFMDTVLSNPIC